MDECTTKALQILLLNELLRIGSIDDALYKLATYKLRSNNNQTEVCFDSISQSMPIAITA